MRKIILLFFSLLFINSFAQNGYIIKGKDTIKVNVDMSGFHIRASSKEEKLQKKVNVTENGISKTYKAGELSGFCFQNENLNCFDNFGEGKDAIYLLRIASNKNQNFKVYQIVNSGFIGVNYSVALGYLIQKKGSKDLFFSPKSRKGWKDSLLEIVKDCPEIYQTFSKSIEIITFETEFQDYLNQYISKCRK